MRLKRKATASSQQSPMYINGGLKPSTVVYTDGGLKSGAVKGRGIGGTGIVVLDPADNTTIVERVAWNFPTDTTNQKMELMAAVQGIDIALALFPNNDVNIVTDSAYIVNCHLEKWWLKWVRNGWLTSSNKCVENISLWRELLKRNKLTHDECVGYSITDKEDIEVLVVAAAARTIHFIKVKGHSGDIFNEEADRMAQLGKNSMTNVLSEKNEPLMVFSQSGL